MTDEKTPLEEQPFRMSIEDVFPIRDRGILVVGTVLSGSIKKGDAVDVLKNDKRIIHTVISGIDTGLSGLLLPELTTDQVKPGMMLVAPETSEGE